MGVARRPHLRPEARRRHVGGRADRLGDDGSHVALLLQDVAHEVGARQPAHLEERPPVPLGVAVGAPVTGRRGDMLGAGQQGTVRARAVLPLAAHARRREARPVVSVPERDRLEAPGRHSREPERDLHRVVAGRRQQDLAQGLRRQLREPPREGDGDVVGEPARREREVVELGLQRRDECGVRVPQVMDAVAVEVHEPAPARPPRPRCLPPAGPPIGRESTLPGGGSTARRPRRAGGRPTPRPAPFRSSRGDRTTQPNAGLRTSGTRPSVSLRGPLHTRRLLAVPSRKVSVARP